MKTYEKAYLEDEAVRYKEILRKAEFNAKWRKKILDIEESTIENKLPQPTYSVVSTFKVTPASLTTMFRNLLP